MIVLKNKISKYVKLVSITGFFVLIYTGLHIYKDYGIGWDEEYARMLSGKVVYEFIQSGNEEVYLQNSERYHGPLFETILYAAEILSGYKDIQQIYFLRHLLTFLLFLCGVVCFYFLLLKLFHHHVYALIGCMMLVLSPRIFADAFYNTKDIAFLSFYIFASFSLWRLLEAKSISNILLHALLTSLAIDVRITAIIIPVVTVLLLWWQYKFVVTGITRNEFIKNILLLTVFTCVFVILFWPILWLNPPLHFTRAFIQMCRFGWNEPVVFMNNVYTAHNLPRYYSFVWIMISTPLLYLALCFSGIIIWLKIILTSKLKISQPRLQLTGQMFLWVAPLGAVIVLHSVIYDGWRHLYFIYPGMVVCAVYGLHSVWNYYQTMYAKALIVIAGVVQLCSTTFFIYSNHPHEMVYFNSLTPAYAGPIRFNYEQDYWGLSYRKGLEYIARIDPRDSVCVEVANTPGVTNTFMLDKNTRARIYASDSALNADYFVGNYRYRTTDYTDGKEIYNVYSDGYKILSVRRLK